MTYFVLSRAQGDLLKNSLNSYLSKEFALNALVEYTSPRTYVVARNLIEDDALNLKNHLKNQGLKCIVGHETALGQISALVKTNTIFENLRFLFLIAVWLLLLSAVIIGALRQIYWLQLAQFFFAFGFLTLALRTAFNRIFKEENLFERKNILENAPSKRHPKGYSLILNRLYEKLNPFFFPQEEVTEKSYRVYYTKAKWVLPTQLTLILCIAILLYIASPFLGILVFLAFSTLTLFARQDCVELLVVNNTLIYKNETEIRKKNRLITLDIATLQNIRSLKGGIELALENNTTLRLRTTFTTLPFPFQIISKKESMLNFLRKSCPECHHFPDIKERQDRL